MQLKLYHYILGSILSIYQPGVDFFIVKLSGFALRRTFALQICAKKLDVGERRHLIELSLWMSRNENRTRNRPLTSVTLSNPFSLFCRTKSLRTHLRLMMAAAAAATQPVNPASTDGRVGWELYMNQWLIGKLCWNSTYNVQPTKGLLKKIIKNNWTENLEIHKCIHFKSGQIGAILSNGLDYSYSHMKSDFHKFQISNVSWFQMVRFQIPTVFWSHLRGATCRRSTTG